VSRGRLTTGRNRDLGSFTQRIELVAGLPVALIDIDVRLVDAPVGPLFEHHPACRFAWHENEDMDVRRSLHTQSIATERGLFTAPWFIELCRPGERDGSITILTGGLPWHMRSSPHMLDSILPSATATPRPGEPSCRLAVGIGIDRPWDLAAALLADPLGTALPSSACRPMIPANVRLIAGPVRHEGDRLVAARIGLLESEGRPGEVRLEWATGVARVRDVVTGSGHPAHGPGEPATIDGHVVTVTLRRYQWRHLDVEFD
jgi:hypothetical protein